MEAGYKCANPVCRHVLTLDIHHIVWVSEGGGSSADDLLALCPNCHSLHTAGHIPQQAIRHWKGMLVALNHAFDRHSMDLPLFLHKDRTGFTYYSADGLLHFAGLIAAGLAATGSAVGGGLAMAAQVSTSVHQVVLTERGRFLVEAWMAGDEEQYRKMLGGEPPDGS